MSSLPSWRRVWWAIAAALANAYTRICFRLGHEDARRLAQGFSGFSAVDLEDLGIGQAIARVGRARGDFNLETELPGAGDAAMRRRGQARSRARWGDPMVAPASIARSIPTGGDDLPPPLLRDERASPSEPRQRPSPGGASPGRGGAEHKYLQQLTKRLAEDRGWRATIEQELDAGGRVDVALSRRNRRVAVEISVSTDVRHELNNIRKCIDAGFALVVVVVADARRRRRLEAAIQDANLKAEARMVVASELPGLLESLDIPTAEIETTVRGYRVKVTASDRSQASGSASAIARVVAGSLKAARGEK